MNKAKNIDRISYLDIAKGISIICIILGHLDSFAINRVVFTFHVPIFFLISGYFIDDKLKITDFIKKKAKRLLIPYYITCLVIILLALYFGFHPGTIKGKLIYWLKASLYAAGSPHSKPFQIDQIGAIWFLWALFWGSIFLRISLAMRREIRIIFIGSLFLIGYYTRNLFWLPLSIQPGACSVLFLYIGYLFKIYKDRIAKIPLSIKVILSLVALIISILFIINFKSFYLVECDIGRGVIDIIGCLCSCWIVILISQFIDRHTRILKNIFINIGEQSLILLCVHIVELNLLPWSIIPYTLSIRKLPPFNWISILIVKLPFDLLVTYLIVKFSKKKKSIKQLKQA